MRTTSAILATLALCATALPALQALAQAAASAPAQARPPAKAGAKALQGDLTVELRQTEVQAGYTVGTQPRTPPLTPQQVQVRNGETAVMRMGQSMPVKWTQSVAVDGGGRGQGAGVSYGLVWMEAGQGFTVTPRWAGGRQPASLQIEVLAASVDASTGGELPNQQRSQFSTTLSAPLGEWVTVAATGGDQAQAGVYSTRTAPARQQLIQVRVSAR